MLIARLSVVEDGRVAERRSFSEETTIRINNRPATVEVSNLSTSGCLLRSNLTLEPGMEVRIGLRGVGSFVADVVRVDGADAGCQFRQALRPDQVDLAFTNNVVFNGPWDPAEEAEPEFQLDRTLSPSAKLITIVGLSAGLWALIGAAIVSFR